MKGQSSARCQVCAARNPVGFTYCLTCGARVRQRSWWPRGPEPIWQRSYCLVRMEDRTGAAEVGTGYPLDELRQSRSALTIGSDETSDIVLAHPSVAPHHAWLIREGGGFLIEDADSEAGTFVNDQPISRACRLRVRDTVRIGECALVYALADDVCPYCHSADSLISVADARRQREAAAPERDADDGDAESALPDMQAAAPGPSHECHHCGRQFWVVTTRWAGWWRWLQWRTRALQRQVVARQLRSSG
ncbi:MAG: FHA domain-containing protein [Chloroflexota bacterium]